MILIISDKRSDAIGIYAEELFARMVKIDKSVKIITVDNRTDTYPLIHKLIEVWNTIKIVFNIHHDDVVLFVDPKRLNAGAAFFLSQKKHILFYHIDENPVHFRTPVLRITHLLRKFDTIIAVSNFSKSQLIDVGILPDRIQVVYPGLDHDVFRPVANRPPECENRYILAVGTEANRKNYATMLQVLKILGETFPDLKMIKTGGPGSVANRRRTLADIAKLGLENDVIFTGHLPNHATLSRYYSHAELLLFPSLLEGFGFPLAEAMACGCPIVTSDRDPMRELVGDTQILIDPENVHEIAEACRLVLTDQSLRNTMREQGIKRAGMFNWENTARKIYDIMRAPGI